MIGLLTAFLWAAGGKVGQSYAGVDVLFELGAGGRPLGLGSAFSAVSDDESAAMFNPAGLGWYEGLGIISVYANQFGAADFALFGATGPGVGISLLALDSGPIREGLSYRAEGAVVALGHRFPGEIGLGLRGRLFRTVAPSRSHGWAVDLGLLWRGPLAVGIVGEGLLAQGVWTEMGQAEPWPTRFTAGIAVPLALPAPLFGLAAGEAYDLGGALAFRGGVELWIRELGIRAGIAEETLTLGMSVRQDLFQLDGVMMLHRRLPAAFRISLTLRL